MGQRPFTTRDLHFADPLFVDPGCGGVVVDIELEEPELASTTEQHVGLRHELSRREPWKFLRKRPEVRLRAHLSDAAVGGGVTFEVAMKVRREHALRVEFTNVSVGHSRLPARLPSRKLPARESRRSDATAS